MNINKSLGILMVFLFAVNTTSYAQNTAEDEIRNEVDAISRPQVFLNSLTGSWEGTCRTWFRPGELVDESNVRGEFSLILNGRFLRHTYEGELLGKPRTGEETIAFNSVKNKFQTSWMDDFHMNYGIMFSEGDITDNGFIVAGEYDVGLDQPPWGWKTVFELSDEDNLTITAYNVLPDGTEAKAVETKYIRKYAPNR